MSIRSIIVVAVLLCTTVSFGQSKRHINAASLTIDHNGSLYYADALTLEIFRIDAATKCRAKIAGNQRPESSGDGGLAINAGVNPSTVLADRDGNLLIAEIGGGIRRIDRKTGIISTIFFAGKKKENQDGGSLDEAGPVLPGGLALDSKGNLYVSDSTNHRILRIDTDSGRVTTFAGGGDGSFSDGGPATKGVLSFPDGIAFDRDDNLFIAEQRRIRRVDSKTGIITTIARAGESTDRTLVSPRDLAIDDHGNIFVIAGSNSVLKLDSRTYAISRYAGTGREGLSGDNGPAVDATLSGPSALTIDVSGNVFVADYENHRIRRIDAKTKKITSIDMCPVTH